MSSFIEIHNTNIKYSNIKTFGVSTEEYEAPMQLGDFEVEDGFWVALKGVANVFLNENQTMIKKRKYLYVTTYQDNNYRFYEQDININEVLQNLKDKLK